MACLVGALGDGRGRSWLSLSRRFKDFFADDEEVLLVSCRLKWSPVVLDFLLCRAASTGVVDWRMHVRQGARGKEDLGQR